MEENQKIQSNVSVYSRDDGQLELQVRSFVSTAQGGAATIVRCDSICDVRTCTSNAGNAVTASAPCSPQNKTLDKEMKQAFMKTALVGHCTNMQRDSQQL